MTNSIVDYVRVPTTGAGVNGATVSIRKHDGAVEITTATADANGRFTKDHDTVGYPGPLYYQSTSGGTTRVHSGNVTGQIGGLFFAADIPDVFQIFGIGVIDGVASELAVSTSGGDMVVTMAAGAAILKDGIPYVAESSKTVTLGAADPTNPRIDRIVLRLTREGQTAQGAISLVAIAGTPAGTPAAPSMTQTSATWDFNLATVRVDAGVVTLAVDKVTDARSYAMTGTGGDWSVGDDLTVTDNATIGGTLTVATDAYAVNVWASGGISASGAATVGTTATLGAVSVTGVSTLTGNVTTGADLTVGDDLIVTDNASVGTDLTVDEDLAVSGLSTLAAAAVTGNATVGGTLGVTGTLTAAGDIAVGDDLTVTGSITTDSSITAALALWTDTSLHVGTNASIGGTLDFTGTSPGIALGAAAGTSPGSPSLSGTDSAGRIVFTTGTSMPSSGTLFTVTFNVSRANTNYGVNVYPQDADAAADVAKWFPAETANATTTWRVDVGAALQASTSYRFGYRVVGFEP